MRNNNSTCHFVTTYLLLAFILVQHNVVSQNAVIDSLNKIIVSDKDDIEKVNHLNALSWQYIMIGNSDSTIAIANRALILSNTLSKKDQLNGSSNSYSNLAMGFADKGNFPASLSHFFKALKINEELGEKKTISSALANIGNVYANMGDVGKAIQYFLKSLTIAEELKDKKATANTQGNIGNLYDMTNDQEKALEYYFKALNTYKEINDKNGVGVTLGNIGLAYNAKGEKDKAIEYYKEALKFANEVGNLRSQAIWNGNIGDFYVQELSDLSSTKNIQNKKTAEIYLLKALEIDTAIDFLHHTSNTYQSLSLLYSNSGDYKKSLEYYRQYTFTKDSLFDDEKRKEITKYELNYEFEKKETALKAEQEKKEILALADKKRQSILFWLISSVAIAIGAIALIIFRTLFITKKQKKIIELQKSIVEEKQKEIIDSIRYAKRIQQALLPSEKYIAKCLKKG